MTGSLYEDALFCPKTERAFESLEWWGENAFFSRTADCSSFGGSCVKCVTQDVACGWCISPSSHRCRAPGQEAECSQDFGCVLEAVNVDTTPEDTAITIPVGRLFLVPTEKNNTNVITSTVMTVNWTVTPASTCLVSYNPDTDIMTLTPFLNWNGVCRIIITATSPTPTQGYRTRLQSNWTVTVTPVNDKPSKLDSFDNTVDALNSLVEASKKTLDGCKMFEDVDKADFMIDWSGDIDGGLNLATGSFPTGCHCYTGNRKCDIVFTGLKSGAGKVDFIADDGFLTSDPINPSNDVAVTGINHKPVCTPPGGMATYTTNENNMDEQVALFDFCTDVDSADSLSFTISNEISKITKDYNPDGLRLVFHLNGFSNGVATSTVTVSDGNGGTTTFLFKLTVTAVNDDIEIKDSSFDGRTYTGLVNTSQTFNMSDVVKDEESTFNTSTLVCTPTPSSPSDSTLANVIIDAFGNGKISFLKTTPGVVWSIACRDTPLSNVVTFSITVEVTFQNHPPKSKGSFPLVQATPSPAGQVAATPSLNLTLYFDDDDLSTASQTLTYSATTSSTLISVTITSNVLVASVSPSASGDYNVVVTATDDLGATFSQNLTVGAYLKMNCTAPSTISWNPVSPFVFDISTVCAFTGTATVTWSEVALNNTLVGSVVTTVKGNNITFTAANSCISGKYTGLASVRDSRNAVANVSISLETKTSTTVTSAKSSYQYLVTKNPTDPYTGYDASAQVSGDGKVHINLVQLVKICGQAGPLKFTSSAASYNFTGGPANSDALESELEGVNLFIEGRRVASILRAWTFNTTIGVLDTKTNSSDSVLLTVVKPFSG